MSSRSVDQTGPRVVDRKPELRFWTDPRQNLAPTLIVIKRNKIYECLVYGIYTNKRRLFMCRFLVFKLNTHTKSQKRITRKKIPIKLNATIVAVVITVCEIFR